MRLLLYGLIQPNDDRTPARCCDDRPTQTIAIRRAPLPVRGIRKMSKAIGPSFALFRHQIAEPLSGGLDVGMPVVSSSGRALGTVSGVVVEIGSGRTSYAVAPDEPREGHVLLLPRESVREDRQTAVIEEDVLQDLRRRTA